MEKEMIIDLKNIYLDPSWKLIMEDKKGNKHEFNIDDTSFKYNLAGYQGRWSVSGRGNEVISIMASAEKDTIKCLVKSVDGVASYVRCDDPVILRILEGKKGQ